MKNRRNFGKKSMIHKYTNIHQRDTRKEEREILLLKNKEPRELLDIQEIIEPRKEIIDLSIEMELRLREFDNDKGICGWKDKGFRHLFRKIDRNLLKAENVIFNNILNNSFSNKKKCKKDTIKQLVDAANYIVMILDNLKEK